MTANSSSSLARPALSTIVLRSLVHHRRLHVAVALGVATATAVLTGALLVGDSVRGSLRDLTRERLGRIDALLALDRFFRRELVTEFASQPEFRATNGIAVPAILFPQATLEHRQDSHTRRASSVLVMGTDESFWQLDVTGVRPSTMPGDREVVLNESLATELQAAVGDEVTLRMPKANQVPADSPLANKNDRVTSLPGLKVVAIIPTRGLGRFALQASQNLPWNAFVSVATLQEALDQPDLVNAFFVGGVAERSEEDFRGMAGWLRPRLSDFGVEVGEVTRSIAEPGKPAETRLSYYTVTTPRMIFGSPLAATIERTLSAHGGQPVLTYLANSIEPVTPNGEVKSADSGKQEGGDGDRGGGNARSGPRGDIPYSMVTALDIGPGFPLLDSSGQAMGPLGADDIVLNSWTAENLGVRLGDRIRLRYFEPETSHGAAVERSAEFVLKAITPLVRPAKPHERGQAAVYQQPPAVANDPELTPEVKGVTDQDTIDDWDAPFPFDYLRVKDEDEAYWDDHRTSPKAFVSVEAGRRMWGSRFGQVTSFRVPAGPEVSVERLRGLLERELAKEARAFGFEFQAIRARQLAASQGTTPFDVLFLSLSFFVIAAALLLVALLFQLGIEERARELGTLLAVGYPRRLVTRLFLMEGVVVASCGAVLGLGLGVAYARAMLWGLTTWWLDAISAPFVSFHWTGRSLAIGYLLGLLTTVVAIAVRIRSTRQVSIRSLLTGRASSDVGLDVSSVATGRLRRWIARTPHLVPWLAAIVLATAASQLGGMAQAGAFVAAGAAMLTGLLLAVRRRFLAEGQTTSPPWTRRWLLWGMAERNAGRNPGRSLLTIALMSSATFLIVAMSSFRLAPTDSGIGGFDFLATSAEPIYDDLNDPAKREEYFGSQASVLQGWSVFGFRLRPGDDASCQNLYQSAQPRVLGVPRDFIEHFEPSDRTSFAWAGTAATTPEVRRNPWRLLTDQAVGDNDAVPVVLDKNTALYSLKLYRGIGEEFTFDYDGNLIRFRVAGFLENSVLQGSLLISEADFRQRFPHVSGFRFFLMDTGNAGPGRTGKRSSEQEDGGIAALEERLGDQGFDAVATRELLAQLLGVQNAYLSTFQSLGALGLLLGALGLATVQLRNIFERRGELALQRAVGYPRQLLVRLVLLECVVLLVGGLATGFLAALLAVLPHKLLGSAAFSWLLLRDLALMLGVVLVVGLASSYGSVRAVSRLKLLSALRGE